MSPVLERLAGVEERCRNMLVGLGWSRARELPAVPPEPHTPDYYLYGVLGAKNVGKSSLVASILGLDYVPEEGRELGEGTRRPCLYASPELLPRVRSAFARAGVEVDVAESPGRAGEFEKIAFVDLPDIESRFEEHFETVRKVEDRILGLVMIRTAESSFDEAFLRKLRGFHRDDRDLYFVMNKFDQWVAARDGDVAAAEAACTDHLAEVLKRLDLDSERVYFTDARPEEGREQDGFQLPRLAADLLRDKSTEELERAKVRNWVHALRYFTLHLASSVHLGEGRAHLDSILGRCRNVVEGVERAEGPGPVASVLPASLVENFEQFLDRALSTNQQTEQAEHRLIRRVFFHRVDHLPFARVLAAPLYFLGELVDGLFHRLPRAFSGQPALVGSDENETREMVRGVVDSVEEAFYMDRAALARLFRDTPEERIWEVPEGEQLLRAALHQWLRQREERICAEARPPWLLTRLAMWLPVLFFLLLRPLARLWVDAGQVLSVTALSAALPGVVLEYTSPQYILLSVFALVAFYVLVLCTQYRLAHRAVSSESQLEDVRRKWVQSISLEFWRELFERVVPDGFRPLEHALDEFGSQLDGVVAALREIDAEAVENAEQQFAHAEEGAGARVTDLAARSAAS